jgi:threonine aldolase
MSMRVVDLRSDTVTLPTREMLDAMRNAELGDDAYGEDPTVNRLETLAANKMRKEAALLTTSGTQANLVSVMSQTKRGDEVILEAEAHTYTSEAGALSVLGDLVPKLVKGHMGIMKAEDIEFSEVIY